MKLLPAIAAASLTVTALTSMAPAAATDEYIPTPENLEARERFRNAGLGVFIHWVLSYIV